MLKWMMPSSNDRNKLNLSKPVMAKSKKQESNDDLQTKFRRKRESLADRKRSRMMSSETCQPRNLIVNRELKRANACVRRSAQKLSLSHLPQSSR